MPVSVRLDEETEALLNKTAKTLRTTKSKILKASVQDFCKKTLDEKRKKPYDLISDLIGTDIAAMAILQSMLKKSYRNSRFSVLGSTFRR